MNTTTAADFLQPLGPIAALELVRLPSPLRDNDAVLAEGFGGSVLALVENEGLEQIVGDLVSLQAAEQARCHVPVYGYRLHDTLGDELEISICFTCNNGRALHQGQLGWFTFDATSTAAHRLLDEFRHADPSYAPST